MPYGRYLREMAGLPTRISKCAHCQVELQRNPAIYALLSLGSTAAVLLIFFAVPRLLPAGWGGMWTVLLLMVASVFLINFLGWLLVGWRVASALPAK
jgi:hypothetical protein